MIIHNMEQRSYEWYQIKLGKLTSTHLKSVLATKGDALKVIDSMLAEEISGMSDDEDAYVSDKMQRGIDLEPLARKEYESVTGYSVDTVGFLQSSQWENFGVSADGLVGKNGAVEIKCPDTKTHVRYIREGIIPKEYHYQTLCYFLVHEELEWLHFISYDPRFTVQPCFIKAVNREELEIEIREAEIKIIQFFFDYETWKNKIVFGASVNYANVQSLES